jgi:hypothetical protein
MLWHIIISFAVLKQQPIAYQWKLFSFAIFGHFIYAVEVKYLHHLQSCIWMCRDPGDTQSLGVILKAKV